jgi:hypothetical protein
MIDTLGHWANFYILMGTGATTLIGLMFIALTFGSKLVTDETVALTRAFLSPIIYHFAQAFIISAVALMPCSECRVLGSVTILLAIYRSLGLWHIFKGLKLATSKNHDVERSDWVFGFIFPGILYFLFVLFGAALLMEESWSLIGLGLSVMGIMILGVASAWDMLIWMAAKID